MDACVSEETFAIAKLRPVDARHPESMSPTCADTLHLNMKAQEVNDFIPKLKWQVRAKDDLRGLTVVAALDLGAHLGHAADHSGNLLPQQNHEAVTPVAAGIIQI